ncbi:hypothetical protein OG792_32060 [Micromonospora sp. NBC_01699]|uniref:hypothetical protein n=1 Tax=Micromonospora sp. NBC_01699 TaxID=2975984 RepID=UPI002E281428|nr:hypothetical protein [Micromonospora sp. NBC_01699]
MINEVWCGGVGWGVGVAVVWDWRRVLVVGVRGSLVVLWVLWAALAWWSAPRPADAEQARRDIAADTVTNVHSGTNWDDGGFWGRKPALAGGTDGNLVSWTTDAGRVRYADVGYGRSAQTPDPRDASGMVRDRPLVAELRTAAGVDRTGFVHPVVRTANWVAVSLMAVFLIALVAGPAPIHGTKWYWFWLCWTPFGLGVLAWVTWERWLDEPRAARERQLVGIDGPVAKRRRDGFEGFLLAIVLGIAIGFVTYALRWLLGVGLVPG